MHTKMNQIKIPIRKKKGNCHNREGSQTVSYWPANKSTFLGAGRKHKTTGSETKAIYYSEQ